jgi:hypothetical protein
MGYDRRLRRQAERRKGMHDSVEDVKTSPSPNSRWQRALAWLHKPIGTPPKPDELIELTRMALRIDADFAVTQLSSCGIQAVVFGADAAPHLGVTDGYRVMVRAGDVVDAATALSQGS